jgi:two-component system, LytTR family, response regulator
MKPQCVIVDDEPVARLGLAEDVKELDLFTVAGLAENAYQALDLINSIPIDLLFLDINMPGLSGIDFLKLVKVKPMVIITTAYQQYALDGYELNVVDYLLKPISSDRLRNACQKAIELYNYRNTPSAALERPDHFYIKCNGKMQKLSYDSILYIEAANNYVFIHTAEKRYLTYSTLKGIGGQLPPDDFVRIHKSFIVARSRVQQVSGTSVLVDQVNIPISRNFRQNVQQRILKPGANDSHYFSHGERSLSKGEKPPGAGHH